jgi:hypothetical protein
MVVLVAETVLTGMAILFVVKLLPPSVQIALINLTIHLINPVLEQQIQCGTMNITTKKKIQEV